MIKCFATSPMRRRLLAALSVLPLARTVGAQDGATTYPNRTVRIIVPFGAGGGTDYFARSLAQQLSTRLGQSFVVDNRLGAGGSVGAEVVQHAPADGYTLLFTSNSFTVNAVMSNVPYDAVTDFVPVVHYVNAPLIVVVNPTLPVQTMDELVAYAKANPGKLFFGSSGVGGIAHLAVEDFMLKTGTKMTHVPYKGIAFANTALMTNEVQVVFTDTGAVAPQIYAGQVRALAVGGRQRFKQLPAVPTAAEAGMPWLKLDIWYGLLAPRGTPPAIVDKLNGATAAALRSPELVAALATRFADPVATSAQTFAATVKSDVETWKQFGQQTHLHLN